MTQRRLICLGPTSGPLERKGDRALPGRPARLDSDVIGLVPNGLGYSKDFLNAVFDELSREDEALGAVRVLKPSVSVAPEPADWARLTSETTLAIAGFGG
jgi:hypothetical protein